MAEERAAFPNARQKKLGPAPIASFEDLSEDVDNGGQQVVQRLPGIAEAMTPVTPSCSSLKTPSTPRIDISRASSSSQHEESPNSDESSPERELLAGGELDPGCKLSLGYKEDVQDLRSSTEELDLHDPVHEQDLNREIKRARKRKEDGTQSECGVSFKQQEKERNNSVCSEIILLNISGRTSRLSSVGSQGSGISGKLSAVSNASSRSPSPHKCMLETSFCGSKRTLAENYIEPSKPETEDLEKILLQREADTTKALIPENIRIPIVDGNLKPDPLDKPRLRGRDERKEIFKREVEITKRVLEKVNIQVPIIKKVQSQEQATKSNSSAEKPASLNLNDRRKKAQHYKESVHESPTSSVSPKLQKHQKIRDHYEGSRTPSPASVSRKTSIASLFRGKTDGSVLSPDSPSFNHKPRKSITSKLKETTESLKNVAKRGSIDKGTPLKKDSKNKNVFSSTLSLFRKKERKKSIDDGSSQDIMSSRYDATSSMESIGHADLYHIERQRAMDTVISLHPEEVALPSESVSIPLETPTKLLDEYESSTSRVIKIQTEAKIEVEPKISLSLSQSQSQHLESQSLNSPSQSQHFQRDNLSSQNLGSVSRSQSRSLEKKMDPLGNGTVQCSESQSSSKESFSTKKPEVTKPKRKSREKQLSKQSDSSFEDNLPVQRPPRSQKTEQQKQEKQELQTEPLTKAPSVISDLDHNSSESERDTEMDFMKYKTGKGTEATLDERKTLFYEESFEEDLPYVPTTLPLEKSAAVPIVPIKERLQEVRTIPIERPRSTTPINPTLLDEFVQHTSHEGLRRTEKMKISLPREDSFRAKSPKRSGVANTFSEFAGRVADNTHRGSIGGITPSPPPPPPLPPRGQQQSHQPTNWINFEEIPERRKTPKRIQTIPRSEDEPKMSNLSFVQPEECRCECHEESRKASVRDSPSCSSHHDSTSVTATLERSSCNGSGASSSAAERDVGSGSVVSDSSIDCSLSIEDSGTQPLISPSCPFAMDLDVNSDQSSSTHLLRLHRNENDDAEL